MLLLLWYARLLFCQSIPHTEPLFTIVTQFSRTLPPRYAVCRETKKTRNVQYIKFLLFWKVTTEYDDLQQLGNFEIEM